MIPALYHFRTCFGSGGPGEGGGNTLYTIVMVCYKIIKNFQKIQAIIFRLYFFTLAMTMIYNVKVTLFMLPGYCQFFLI